MRLIYADYNPQTNGIDVRTFEHFILRIVLYFKKNNGYEYPCSVQGFFLFLSVTKLKISVTHPT